MTNNIKNLLVKEKPFKALLAIHRQDEPYSKAVSRQTNSDYQHVSDLVNKFEGLDIVTKKKNGVKNILQLTENGQELAQELERLDRVFKEVDNE